MSRSLSTTARAAIYAQETGEVFLLLLTIDHDDLDSPIRVVDNTEDVTSRGDTYVAFPFDIALPDESPDSISAVRLTIDNVDRQVVDALRSISTPATVTLEVVLASDPDTVEAGPFDLSLRSADYTAEVVTAELVYEDVLNEPFPGGRFIPSDYQALFS